MNPEGYHRAVAAGSGHAPGLENAVSLVPAVNNRRPSSAGTPAKGAHAIASTPRPDRRRQLAPGRHDELRARSARLLR